MAAAPATPLQPPREVLSRLWLPAVLLLHSLRPLFHSAAAAAMPLALTPTPPSPRAAAARPADHQHDDQAT
jgi:hypothetical protein